MSRKMSDRKQQLLESMGNEIDRLRRENQTLRARVEEFEKKRSGYDDLLVALDAAFSAGGCDDTTRKLLRLCAERVGLTRPEPPTEWLMELCRRRSHLDRRSVDDYELRQCVLEVLELSAPNAVIELIARMRRARFGEWRVSGTPLPMTPSLPRHGFLLTSLLGDGL